MATLSPRELLERVVEAVRRGGASSEVVSGTHPFELLVSASAGTRLLRIYIWNVTPGGRDLEGEQRIQVTQRPLTRPTDGDALLLGWHDDTGTFVAFDLDLHADPGHSASVQVKIQTLVNASEDGMTLQRRGPSEVAVAFRPENLIHYVRHKDDVHRVGQIRAPDPVLGVAPEESEEGPDLDLPERERVTTTVSRLLRDASFRSRVLAAYGHACCACDLQLGLIEAAHVIPVGVAGSTDETSNGLALCVLHHRAYDAGLLIIEENGALRLNPCALDALSERGLVAGDEEFKAGLRNQIRFPVAPEDRPTTEALARGRQVRGT